MITELDQLTLKEFNSYKLDCNNSYCLHFIRRYLPTICNHKLFVYHRERLIDPINLLVNYDIFIRHGDGESIFYYNPNDCSTLSAHQDIITDWIQQVHEYESRY